MSLDAKELLADEEANHVNESATLLSSSRDSCCQLNVIVSIELTMIGVLGRDRLDSTRCFPDRDFRPRVGQVSGSGVRGADGGLVAKACSFRGQ